jgi:hypothetical protein
MRWSGTESSRTFMNPAWTLGKTTQELQPGFVQAVLVYW